MHRGSAAVWRLNSNNSLVTNAKSLQSPRAVALSPETDFLGLEFAYPEAMNPFNFNAYNSLRLNVACDQHRVHVEDKDRGIKWHQLASTG